MPEFTVNLNVHFHPTRELIQLLREIFNRGATVSVELDTLTAQVKANNDLAASGVALIQGLAAQIEANKTDPAALQALADSLKASDATLADAISANTPAAPAPTSPAAPDPTAPPTA